MLFRESPTSTGRPSASRTSSRRTSSRLWATVLPKPIPGSRQIRASATPASTANREPFLQKRRDVGRDVVVARLELHRSRLPLHVHQAEVGARVRDDAGQLGIGAQCRHVVHELDAQLERPPRDLRLGRVDRKGYLAGEPLEHRQDATQLLVERDRLRTGPRRLAAHVHERGAVGRHRTRQRPPRRQDRAGGRRRRSCRASRSRSPSPRAAANVPPRVDVSLVGWTVAPDRAALRRVATC